MMWGRTMCASRMHVRACIVDCGMRVLVSCPRSRRSLPSALPPVSLSVLRECGHVLTVNTNSPIACRAVSGPPPPYLSPSLPPFPFTTLAHPASPSSPLSLPTPLLWSTCVTIGLQSLRARCRRYCDHVCGLPDVASILASTKPLAELWHAHRGPRNAHPRPASQPFQPLPSCRAQPLARSEYGRQRTRHLSRSAASPGLSDSVGHGACRLCSMPTAPTCAFPSQWYLCRRCRCRCRRRLCLCCWRCLCSWCSWRCRFSWRSRCWWSWWSW